MEFSGVCRERKSSNPWGVPYASARRAICAVFVLIVAMLGFGGIAEAAPRVEVQASSPAPAGVVNGCTGSPDGNGGANFKPVCDAHDLCYESAKSRGQCDLELRDGLYVACKRAYMSPIWRVSSIVLALSISSLSVGQYLDWQTKPGEGVNIGAGFLSLAGMGLGIIGLLLLVGAIVGDVARSRDARDDTSESG